MTTRDGASVFKQIGRAPRHWLLVFGAIAAAGPLNGDVVGDANPAAIAAAFWGR
jgi:hypothetical protein